MSLITRLPRKFFVGSLVPGFQRMFGMSEHTSPLPNSVPRASNQLKDLEWPEEDLSSTAQEGAGFYPLRLGEAFDDERFIIIRKLGWGGYSTVWLAKDLQ